MTSTNRKLVLSKLGKPDETGCYSISRDALKRIQRKTLCRFFDHPAIDLASITAAIAAPVIWLSLPSAALLLSLLNFVSMAFGYLLAVTSSISLGQWEHWIDQQREER